MSNYVLRWQYGVFAGDTRTHYTYGSLSMLRHKAESLAKDDKVVYITIDKVVETIKDTRLQTVESLI
ncbi:MAG: hypothetical protein ACI4OP_04300 [Candidatus Coprovivens sp.]